VKHLLIILISIILLSSFLTSCEKKEKILYGWKTSSGWEWKTIGDKNNNPQYKGEVKREYIIFGDYIREGVGILTYSDGDKYVGEWKDGQKNGQGTYTWSNGNKYLGEYKDGKKHGQGTMTWKGLKYVGEYKDGKQHGQGTKTYSDGEKYVGEWKDGRKSGQGTLTYSDGEKYVGEFKDGESDGQGTYTWSDGRKYVGEWKDGETKRSWYCHFTLLEVCRGMEGE